MSSGHSKLTKVFDSHPFPFSSSGNCLAMENMESKFEMSEGLFESADELFDLDLCPYFLANMVSQSKP